MIVPNMSSKIQELKDKVKIMKYQLYDLEKELENEIQTEKQQKLINYYDDVDKCSLDKYIDNIEMAVSDERYYIKEITNHIWLGYRIMVYDKILNKPVKTISITTDSKLIIDDITEYDIE